VAGSVSDMRVYNLQRLAMNKRPRPGIRRCNDTGQVHQKHLHETASTLTHSFSPQLRRYIHSKQLTTIPKVANCILPVSTEMYLS